MDIDSSTPLSPGERKISPLPPRARNRTALPPSSTTTGTADRASERERSASPILTIIPPVPIPRIVITDDAAPLVASPESSPPPSPGVRKICPLPQRFWQSTQGTITKPTFEFTLTVPRAAEEAPKTATAAPAIPASSEPSRLPSSGFMFQLPGSGDAPALRGGDAPATRDVGKTLLGGTDENETTDAVSGEAGEMAVDRKMKPLPPRMRRPAGTPNVPLPNYVPTYGQTTFVNPQLNTWQDVLEAGITAAIKQQDQVDAAAKTTMSGTNSDRDNQTSIDNGTGSSHPVYNSDSAKLLILYGEMMAGASAADLAASSALLALGGSQPETSSLLKTSVDRIESSEQTNDEAESGRQTDVEMDFSDMTDEEVNATLSSLGFNPASDQSFSLDETKATCEATFEPNMFAGAPIPLDGGMTVVEGQSSATAQTDQCIDATNYHLNTIQLAYDSELNYALGYNNPGYTSTGQEVHQGVYPPQGRQDNSLAASSSTATPTLEVNVHDYEQVDWSDSEIVPSTSPALIPEALDNLGIGSQEVHKEISHATHPFQDEEVEATNTDEDMEEVDIDAALAEREVGQHVLVQDLGASSADSSFEESFTATQSAEISSVMITPTIQAREGSYVLSADLAESAPRPNEEVGVACWSTSSRL
ncbi:hypothetical protein NLJ89_g7050 [Agrocybe chaxingu]|uniref:Uncharacterized protein n=1 Tax=Agrocybe chaxingu TaxID=84603 RepID=A0A9W8JY38_9AGAR|nr:hypothetical protein NLJ89_g7050 [Agrocybe chaxingu]